MLALTRKPREALIFRGPDGAYLGKIVVLDTSRGKVKLGIDLPREVSVIREEMDDGWVAKLPDPA
jgi:sRNA-binding carbon storage regulator CsrA